MDTVQQPLPHSIPIDKLALGNNMHSITVRLMRSWEARNFKTKELMSCQLLLLDEADSLIQASIHHRKLPSFNSIMKEGRIFSISQFEVVQANDRFKVSDNRFSIRFIDATQIFEVSEGAINIKKEMFRVFPYPDLFSLANSNMHLPDVVGQILSIQGPNLDDSTSTEKIVLLLMLQEKTTVRVTIWDDQASEFRRLYSLADRKMIVLVCTCVNPKLFAGTLYLNSTGATKFFLDASLNVITDFLLKMGLKGECPTPAIDIKGGQSNEMETWNVNKIMRYIADGAQEEKEILCSARIVGISSRNGWQYVSCAKCAKKLVRSATTFLCNACNNYNAIGVVKFRVELLIDDGTGRSTFVIFDRDARKLTNTTAEDLNASKVTVSDGHTPAEDIPLCLRELVGKSFQFHLRITKFNFTSRFQTFTITRVLQEISEGTNCSSPPQKVGAEQKTITTESKVGSISPSTMESEDVTGSAKDKNPTGSGDEPTPPNIGDRVILPGQHSAKKIRLE